METNLRSPAGQGKGFRVYTNCRGRLWKIECGDIIFFTLQKNHVALRWIILLELKEEVR